MKAILALAVEDQRVNIYAECELKSTTAAAVLVKMVPTGWLIPVVYPFNLKFNLISSTCKVWKAQPGS